MEGAACRQAVSVSCGFAKSERRNSRRFSPAFPVAGLGLLEHKRPLHELVSDDVVMHDHGLNVLPCGDAESMVSMDGAGGKLAIEQEAKPVIPHQSFRHANHSKGKDVKAELCQPGRVKHTGTRA